MFDFIRKIVCGKKGQSILRKNGDESLNKLIHLTEELNSRSALLKESEEKYKNLVDNLQEGIWQIDKDGKTIFINERMAEMLGYPLEEVSKKSLFDFMDQEGIDITKQHIENRKRGIREQYEFWFDRKDGKRIATIIEAVPLFDENRNYTGILSGIIDITERKRIEENLYVMKFASDNSSVPTNWVDSNANLIYVNKKFCENLGYSSNELLKMKIFDIDPEYNSMKVWRNHWKDLRERRVLDFKTKHKTRSGRIISVKVTANFVEFKEKETLVSFIQALSKPITRTSKK